MAAVAAAPVLPEGEPLAPGHAAAIEAALAPRRAQLGRACLSDYAFSNLYLFRAAHAYRYLPGPWPCVAGLTYDGTRHLLPLFDLAAAPDEVLRGLLAQADCFFPVDAATARALQARPVEIEACEADADYLYPADNFRHYRGELLRKKRQLMQQLLRRHEVTSEPLAATGRAAAQALLRTWMQDKGKAQGEADEAPCLEALELLDRFGLEGRLYFADGAPAGFLIAQRLNDEVAVMRFSKGSDAYKGIYQYMFHDHAMRHPELAWLNFEQDLGLPNFRQTKRSYAPAALLTKYRVRCRA